MQDVDVVFFNCAPAAAAVPKPVIGFRLPSFISIGTMPLRVGSWICPPVS